jgi:hypothetical protein
MKRTAMPDPSTPMIPPHSQEKKAESREKKTAKTAGVRVAFRLP